MSGDWNDAREPGKENPGPWLVHRKLHYKAGRQGPDAEVTCSIRTLGKHYHSEIMHPTLTETNQ